MPLNTTWTAGRICWIAGTAIVVLIVNVGLSVLYVAAYGFLINPGHDPQFYRDYARIAAPYCSIVAGMPLMFLAGRFLGRRWDPNVALHAAVFMWLTYAIIDLIFLLAGERSTRLVVLTIVSLSTKLAAAYAGGVMSRNEAGPLQRRRS